MMYPVALFRLYKSAWMCQSIHLLAIHWRWFGPPKTQKGFLCKGWFVATLKDLQKSIISQIKYLCSFGFSRRDVLFHIFPCFVHNQRTQPTNRLPRWCNVAHCHPAWWAAHRSERQVLYPYCIPKLCMECLFMKIVFIRIYLCIAAIYILPDNSRESFPPAQS